MIAEKRISHYEHRLPNVKVLKTLKGKELVGKRYLPLFDFAEGENAYRILEADFVDTQTGTGIVHIAPAFGEDDFNLCADQDIDIFDPVGLDGRFEEKAGFLSGMNVFEANKHVIAHLKEKGRLLLRENYRHSYPPLLALRQPPDLQDHFQLVRQGNEV